MAYYVFEHRQLDGGQVVPDLFKVITLMPSGGKYSLSVAWSLTYEVFFYAYVFLSMLVFPPGIRRVSAILLLAVLPLSAIIQGFSPGYSSQTLSILSILYSPYLIWFVMGSMGALLAVRLSRLLVEGPPGHLQRIISACSRYSGILWILVITFAIGFFDTVTLGARMLIVISSWFMIMGLAVNERFSLASKFMTFKALLVVGSFSYSLYLIHYPVVLLISKLGFSCQIGELGFATVSVVVSLALAFGYYRLVELRSV